MNQQNNKLNQEKNEKTNSKFCENGYRNISAVVLINENNKELLFQKRTSQAKWNPNAWGFFGGKFENNETKNQCATREIFEETNIKLDENKLNYINLYIYENTNCYFFYYFLSELEIKQFKLQEGQDFCWKSFNQSLDLDFGTVKDWQLDFLNKQVKHILNNKFK